MNPLSPTAPRTSLARLPTPLAPLRRFSEQHNYPTIWVKRDDLTDAAASGNKLRKLEFTIGQALSEGATALITCGGVQSNHCRATAIMASQLGLKAHLILRGKPVTDPGDGNLLLDKLVGAEITYVTSDEYNQHLSEIFATIAKDYIAAGDVPFSIPVGASDEIGLWGYIDACKELKADFQSHQIAPGYIFSATGSGGTAGGLILGNALYELGAEVYSVNVCDDEAYFVNKIKTDFQRWRERYDIDFDTDSLPINILEGYIGPGYGKADQPVFDTIKALARTEGLILDPVYTGKAFHGLMSELEKGRFRDTDNIVFIHTGGIFGLFPHKASLG